MSLRAVAMGLFASAFATPLEPFPQRAGCNPCNPSGATGSTPPSVGPGLKTLYTDILASVKDIHFKKRWEDPVEPRADGFCCAETLDCVKVQGLNIPMCYDKFTTNFAFVDRSYGSLTTGEYVQGGAAANLLTGEFSKDGSKGNIYSSDPSAKPNLATLSIPPQWTGTGVGSAIPPTAIVGSASAPAQQTSGQGPASQASVATTGSAASQQTGGAASGNPSSEAKSAPSAAALRVLPASERSLVVSIFTALMYALYA